jgi:hypothetical protein
MNQALNNFQQIGIIQSRQESRTGTRKDSQK